MSDEELKAKEAETVEEETAAPEESMETLLANHDLPIMTMRKLLDAGAHFGHPTRRRNPKMQPYIYAARNGIHIFDLRKTCDAIINAYEALKELATQGGKVLFVGTKQQVRDIVSQEAIRSGSFYINNRWLGGTLTNFKTIQSRIHYLALLEDQEKLGEFDEMTKKEVSALRKEMNKLTNNLSGIKEMRKVPNAIVVVDPTTEHNAIAEAKKLGIKVFAIADTNSNPEGIDYVIPANDDSPRSVALIVAVLADAIVEGKGGQPVVAYTQDEGAEITMKDAIRQADKENKEKIEKIRAERKARQEKYEKEQLARQERRAQRNAEEAAPANDGEDK